MAKCDLCGQQCDASSMTQLREPYCVHGVVDICALCDTWTNKTKCALLGEVTEKLRAAIAARAGTPFVHRKWWQREKLR